MRRRGVETEDEADPVDAVRAYEADSGRLARLGDVTCGPTPRRGD